jgi:hypothetical protein
VGSVDFFAGFEFHFADGEDVFRPLVEELDDLPIQPVNRFAMYGNVQGVRYAEGDEAGFGAGESDFSDALEDFCSSPAKANCSGGTVAKPGSAVTSASGF